MISNNILGTIHLIISILKCTINFYIKHVRDFSTTEKSFFFSFSFCDLKISHVTVQDALTVSVFNILYFLSCLLTLRFVL